MKLQFDPNQTFQLDAVAAITDLFDGQPQGAPEYAVINVGAWGGLFAGQERTELGAGNRLLLAADKLLANTRAIQTRNDIEEANPTAPLEAWELFDVPANQARLCPHFSVEIETGTGKTYVYLRTIFELKLVKQIVVASKEVTLSPEFQALWERIKPRTTYRVEFEMDVLVQRAVEAINLMQRVETPRVRVIAGQLGVGRGGVTANAVSVAEDPMTYGNRPVPDLLAYLQNETELTRSTLVCILKASGRLDEFFHNPQRFMDAVAAILKHELPRLLVDGIKYERLPGTGPETEWEMLLFKNAEMINYLSALQVHKSVYEYIVYDSEVERAFASQLDAREDIKLFVKLPGWFQIDTPVGTYNPDWALLKHDGQALYLVRETKGTRDFLQLRTSEADKIRCGQQHFATLGVPFAVAVRADDV
jgi:restriction endonuclease